MAFSHPYFITLAISFIITFAVVPYLIKKMKERGFVGVDINKVEGGLNLGEMKQLKAVEVKEAKGKPHLVPRGGGIAVITGFTVGMLFSLVLMPEQKIDLALGGLLSITLIAMIGIIEDFIPLRQVYRTVLPAFAALPLMVLNAGTAMMTLPFIGDVHFGVVYPLILIPLGVIVCSNLINLLAGFNGLEAGVGVVASTGLFGAAYLLGRPESAFIAVALFASCLAFLFFNWYPAKIFPGDSATYVIGGAIASAIIIGNMERVGVILLMPQIIEFFLKARSKFRAENFGTLRKGRLHYAGRVYSLTHVVMKLFKPTEKQLVAILLLFQAVFAFLGITSIYW
ncbi:hypothetical protein HY991_02595 [Candidatus Micrarchaeota archaeon]|nr:hypothetical protein [Candidatus Micrarchaeota archaeon]